MPWSRPSELFRSLNCPASCVLPRIPDEPNDRTLWGKEVHSWKETGLPPTERVDEWLDCKPRDREAIRNYYWPGGDHEVLLKFDENGTAAALKCADEAARKAFFAGAQIRGIVDWVGYSFVWRLTDLKTGFEPPSISPANSPQLLIYADIWLDLHPHESGVLLSFDWWPRYPKPKLPEVIGPEWAPRKLVKEWHHSKLIPAERLAQRPEAKYDARPGDWCAYCKCAPFCPAVNGPLAEKR